MPNPFCPWVYIHPLQEPNQPTKPHDNLPTPPRGRHRRHHLRHRSRQHTTLMTTVKRLWAAYLRIVGYSPRPCPFSGTTPRIQSTINPNPTK